MAGLPTDTEITLTIDRVSSAGTATPTLTERITGVISGGNLTAYTRGVDGSTEQAHSSGAVVEYIWNADDLNDLVDGILVCHNQVGNIKSGAQIDDTSANHQYILGVSELSADRTITLPLLTGNDDFVFEDHAQTLTAKTLTSPIVSGAGGTTAGQHGYDATNKAILIGDGAANQSIFTSAWKAYTPAVTGAVSDIGNATLDCDYVQIGKVVIARINITFGSGSAFTAGNMTVALPVTGTGSNAGYLGGCYIVSAGSGYFGAFTLASTTTVLAVVGKSDGTYLVNQTVTNAVPGTFTTNDKLQGVITYEAA